MADEAKVRAVLSGIQAPGGGDLVTAGAVANIEVSGGEVVVHLRFEGLDRARRHALEDEVTEALERVEGVTEVLLEIEDAHAAPPTQAAPAAEPGVTHVHPAGAKPAKKSALAGVRNVIAVASGKGGVGKSTVAVNLALALKARGARTGLLDIDVYGPSAPVLLGVPDAKPGVSGDQKRFLPVDAFGLRVMSIGFLVEDATPVIWRGPIVGSVVRQFLEDVEWGDLDYLVVDMPPGTGDAQLTLTQQAPITGAIIVTTPSELALVDAVKGLQMFRKVDTPVIGLVENMSHYACPSCGHESQPFNSGGTERVIEQYGVKLLARVPLDLEIQRGGDQGRPVVALKPDAPQSKAFFSLADAVIETCPYAAPKGDGGEKKKGFLSSLFRR